MNQQYYHTIKTRNNLAKIQRFNDIVIMRLSFPWYFSLIEETLFILETKPNLTIKLKLLTLCFKL